MAMISDNNDFAGNAAKGFGIFSGLGILIWVSKVIGDIKALFTKQQAQEKTIDTNKADNAAALKRIEDKIDKQAADNKSDLTDIRNDMRVFTERIEKAFKL